MRRWELQVGVGVGLLALLLWRARVWELGDKLGDFSGWAAVCVLLLNLPAIGLLAVRTHLVLRRLGYHASLLSLAPISALGNVAAVVTPGATGDIIRAPFLKGHHARLLLRQLRDDSLRTLLFILHPLPVDAAGGRLERSRPTA